MDACLHQVQASSLGRGGEVTRGGIYDNIGSSLRMSECRSSEYVELSGIVKEPLTIASGCSPKGVVKKHSLYNIQPSACVCVCVCVCSWPHSNGQRFAGWLSSAI